MKPGDLVRNKVRSPDYLQLFEGVHPDEDWFGMLIEFQGPTESVHYHVLRFILSSHGGTVHKCYLRPDEIETFIEVIE